MKEAHIDPRVLEFIRLVAVTRKEKKLCYEQLGRLAGVHRTTISLIERRKFNPTLQMCLRIADALELSLSQAFQQTKSSIPKSKKNKDI